MTSITKEDLALLNQISKISELLEKLQDKATVKALKESGAAKFKEADALVEKNQKILNDIRDEVAALSHKQAKIEDTLEKATLATEKLHKDKGLFKAEKATWDSVNSERLEEIKDRERAVVVAEKNAKITTEEAEASLKKSEAVLAEYKEKLATLKSLAA